MSFGTRSSTLRAAPTSKQKDKVSAVARAHWTAHNCCSSSELVIAPSHFEGVMASPQRNAGHHYSRLSIGHIFIEKSCSHYFGQHLSWLHMYLLVGSSFQTTRCNFLQCLYNALNVHHIQASHICEVSCNKFFLKISVGLMWCHASFFSHFFISFLRQRYNIIKRLHPFSPIRESYCTWSVGASSRHTGTLHYWPWHSP